MELNKSNVQFTEEGHIYELNGVNLQGITTTLIPAVFGDYTKNIPADVLIAAAERGTEIHKEIGRIIAGESFATDYEPTEYCRLMEENKLQAIASEYIVTDGEHFASAIDIVCEGDIIADIKTTSEIHYGELSFQLSWYACYYEALNKRPIQKAYGIWLPKEQYGKCSVFEVKTQPAEVIREIVAKYLAGEDVTSYADLFTPQLPATATSVVTKIREKKAQLEAIQAEYNDMEAMLKEAFSTMGVKKFENDQIAITRIDATTRTTLDSKAVQKSYPEVYEKCKKTSEVKGSIRITIK